MLDLRNNSPFPSQLGVDVDADGEQRLLVCVKACFSLPAASSQEPLEPLREQVPICSSPVYYDEEQPGSLKFDSEMGSPISGTDVGLVGDAHNAQGGVMVDAGLRLGGRAHVVRVHGPRHWRHGALGWHPSPAQPFKTSPLTFEEAFGGWDRSHADPNFHEYESRNPVGRGFFARRSEGPSEGQLLPSIEPQTQTLADWRKGIEPVGFGFVAPHWQPRAHYAGTYDEDWQRDRCPLLPRDFDTRFHCVAVPQLHFDEPLAAGLAVEIWNVAPYEYLSFPLPNVQLVVEAEINSVTQTATPTLQRVTLVPGAGHVSLVFKASFPCTRQTLRIPWVKVDPI